MKSRLRHGGLESFGAFRGADIQHGKQTLTDLAQQTKDTTLRYVASMLLAETELKKRDGELDAA
jgi:hypothetical protein